MKTEVEDEFDEARHLAELEAADKFAKELIDQKCIRCSEFEKALAHTICICIPIRELITAHISTKGEQDCIVAAWMTRQKVNREGK
jgi:hypothetical protein